MASPTPVDVQVSGKDSGTTVTFNLSCTGNDRAVSVEASSPAGVTATATCGGVSMTEHAQIENSSAVRLYVFRLIAPTPGTNSIVVTTGSSSATGVRARSFSDADQTTPFGVAATQATNGTTPSVTPASDVGDYVCDAMSYANSGQTPTPGSGQTEDTFASSPSFDIRLRGSHETAVGASTVMNWTMTSTSQTAAVGYAVKGIGGAPAAPTVGPMGTRLLLTGVGV